MSKYSSRPPRNSSTSEKTYAASVPNAIRVSTFALARHPRRPASRRNGHPITNSTRLATPNASHGAHGVAIAPGQNPSAIVASANGHPASTRQRQDRCAAACCSSASLSPASAPAGATGATS